MPTSFPAALDSFTNPSANDSLAAVPHDQQHANVNDAIEAMQAVIGIQGSTVEESHEYRITALEARPGMEIGAEIGGSPTVGSVLFVGTDGVLSQDNSNLFWDDANNRLGIGTSSPGATLDVRGAAVFNEAGADADFRIEGDTDANLFFVDASTDRVAIGHSSPGQTHTNSLKGQQLARGTWNSNLPFDVASRCFLCHFAA